MSAPVRTRAKAAAARREGRVRASARLRNSRSRFTRPNTMNALEYSPPVL